MPLMVSVVNVTGFPSRVRTPGGCRRRDRQHRLQAVGAGARVDREVRRGAVPGDRLERRAVAAVEPGEHLAAETTGTPRAWAEATIGVGPAATAAVGVHVGGEDAVVALGAERAVEQRVDGEADRTGPTRRSSASPPGRRRSACRRASAKRIGMPEPVKKPGAVLRSTGGPVVVVRVEADAVGQLDLRLRGPVAPDDAVRAVRSPARGRLG